MLYRRENSKQLDAMAPLVVYEEVAIWLSAYGDGKQFYCLEWRDGYASCRHQVEEGEERARRMFIRTTK